MTIPTANTLKTKFEIFSTLSFSKGIEQISSYPDSISLLNYKTSNDVILPNQQYHLDGKYIEETSVFTIGIGQDKLILLSSQSEFLEVRKSGGNWAIGV